MTIVDDMCIYNRGYTGDFLWEGGEIQQQVWGEALKGICVISQFVAVF